MNADQREDSDFVAVQLGRTVVYAAWTDAVDVNRPVHAANGISYNEDYYPLVLTPEGLDLVEARPELHPTTERAGI